MRNVFFVSLLHFQRGPIKRSKKKADKMLTPTCWRLHAEETNRTTSSAKSKKEILGCQAGYSPHTDCTFRTCGLLHQIGQGATLATQILFEIVSRKWTPLPSTHLALCHRGDFWLPEQSIAVIYSSFPQVLRLWLFPRGYVFQYQELLKKILPLFNFIPSLGQYFSWPAKQSLGQALLSLQELPNTSPEVPWIQLP